jgi:hypothetical protein
MNAQDHLCAFGLRHVTKMALQGAMTHAFQRKVLEDFSVMKQGAQLTTRSQPGSAPSDDWG